MSRGVLHIPSLEEYAKLRKFNSAYTQIDSLSCEECRYCRSTLNACIFGNQVRNFDNMTSCPRVNRFL